MKKVLYLKDIGEVADSVDKAVINYINKGKIETLEMFSDFDIIAFDWYNIANDETDTSQIMIYIDNDDIFFFCEDSMSFDKTMSLFRESPTNEHTLYMFFMELFNEDAKYLEALEDKIIETENSVISNHKKDYTESIICFRQELFRLKKYYEQLYSVFCELGENDNGLLSDESLKYFDILEGKANRFLSNVLNLVEYVTHIREAYQAQIDIEQNSLMKVFTFVTSIFLPLTLLVGWYGMNFDMPEFKWRYGYIAVISVSILVCAVWALIFKKKKWF